jgi:hypothetical protein
MAKQLTQKAAVAKPVKNKLAERDWQPIWYVNGIMLVPHYTRKHLWVFPGGDVYDAAELVVMNAKQSSTLLWPRYWTS